MINDHESLQKDCKSNTMHIVSTHAVQPPPPDRDVWNFEIDLMRQTVSA